VIVPDFTAKSGVTIETGEKVVSPTRKVDIRLPGKGNSNSHGARPVY